MVAERLLYSRFRVSLLGGAHRFPRFQARHGVFISATRDLLQRNKSSRSYSSLQGSTYFPSVLPFSLGYEAKPDNSALPKPFFCWVCSLSLTTLYPVKTWVPPDVSALPSSRNAVRSQCFGDVGGPWDAKHVETSRGFLGLGFRV